MLVRKHCQQTRQSTLFPSIFSLNCTTPSPTVKEFWKAYCRLSECFAVPSMINLFHVGNVRSRERSSSQGQADRFPWGSVSIEGRTKQRPPSYITSCVYRWTRPNAVILQQDSARLLSTADMRGFTVILRQERTKSHDERNTVNRDAAMRGDRRQPRFSFFQGILSEACLVELG